MLNASFTLPLYQRTSLTQCLHGSLFSVIGSWQSCVGGVVQQESVTKIRHSRLPFRREKYTFPRILGDHGDRQSKYYFSFPLLDLSLQSKV